jgi:uncharacterized protein YegL
MRRQPIYFFVDIYATLSIEETLSIENSLINFIKSCKQNPQAIESVYLSINNLCESNYCVNKLTALLDFKSFNLQSQKKRNFNHIFNLINKDFKNDLTYTTINQKGDYTPFVFFFINSDIGYDDINNVNEFKKQKANTFIIVSSKINDLKILKNISNEIDLLNEIDIYSLYSKFYYSGDPSFLPWSEKIENNYLNENINLKKGKN